MPPARNCRSEGRIEDVEGRMKEGRERERRGKGGRERETKIVRTIACSGKCKACLLIQSKVGGG